MDWQSAPVTVCRLAGSGEADDAADFDFGERASADAAADVIDPNECTRTHAHTSIDMILDPAP